MSKRSWRDTLERYLLPICALLLFLIATQVTVANLPSNKLFAGHDSGFYTLFPDQLIRTSAGTWEVKTAFGFPNFQALVTLPYALLVLAVHAFHPSLPLVGRIFFELQILMCEFGTFWIAWLILEKFYGEASRLIRAVASFTAAFVATFNIFTAILLLYPPSNFQAGVFIWPVVIAFELYLLWKRPAFSTAVLFGILLTLATLGNPAHTILGFGLVAAIFITNAVATQAWKWPLLATVGIVTFLTSAFFWVPAFASVFLYHGNVSAPEGANAASLLGSVDLIKLRTTVAALLRFDGLLWWPKTRNAALYDTAVMIVATYAPAVVAVVALFSRKWIVKAFWVLLAVGIELGKNAHPPFQVNMIWLMSSVPLFAAFRQAYDKFALYIMLAMPPLTAIGLIVLLRQRRFVPIGIVAIVLIVLSSWPFLAGRVAEPYFLTTIPPDYPAVARIMGGDPEARVLLLPGGSGEIHVTNWFKGGNFENFLYRNHTVNGAIFKHRSISSAPLYDDFDMVQARELPELIGLLGIYDIKYVLLHKDYLTSYRMAFDLERYKVLGPLVAAASQRLLDADKRLEKIYDGASLVLYRLRDRATLPHAYGAYAAGMALAYENTLFGLVDAGLMDPADRPEMFFLGNQAVSARSLSARSLGRQADFIIKAPLIPEAPALYREQVSLRGETTQKLAKQLGQLKKPMAFVFVQPHGDWLNGYLPPHDNISGSFPLNEPQVSRVGMVVEAARVPKIAYQDYVGLEGDRPWPLSSFSDEPLVDAILTDGNLVDPATAEIPSIRAPASLAIDKTSATYQYKLQRAGDTEELIVASRVIPALSLLDDPKVTFDYEFSDPNIQAAWLRFDLSDRHGHRVFLDKQLDNTGHLEAFGVRDSLQTALDQRFEQLVSLHQTDPQWVARQSVFGPEQADGFRLHALHLIMGKPPFTDFSQTANEVSFRFRQLQIALAGSDPPAYPKDGYHVDFSSVGAHPQLQGVREISNVANNGAMLFSVTTSPTKADSAFSLRVQLPLLDIVKYPFLHLRYWQPASSEKLVVKLGFLSPSGVREVTPGLELGSKDSALPPDWIAKSGFPGLDAPIALDGQAVSVPVDEGWRELTCDLRRIAAYRAGTLRPKLSYVKLTMRLSRPADSPVAISRKFVFGFGDLALVGQADAAFLHPPRRASLEIDGRPQDVVQLAPLGGAKDEFVLRFPTLNLIPGNHSISTRLERPWSVRSVTITPRNMHSVGSPSVTIRHIDDELFAVHVDRHRPMWLAFAETYHAGWRLVKAPAPPNRLQWTASLRWLAKPVGEHVMGNAYNNTWFVAGSAPADFVIDFAPQDFAILGKVMAFVATIVALGLAAWWRR